MLSARPTAVICAPYLESKNISTGIHYPIPIHLQPAYQDLAYRKGDFPIAERYADEILSLPMYPELSEEAITYVCRTIRDFALAPNSEQRVAAASR